MHQKQETQSDGSQSANLPLSALNFHWHTKVECFITLTTSNPSISRRRHSLACQCPNKAAELALNMNQSCLAGIKDNYNFHVVS